MSHTTDDSHRSLIEIARKHTRAMREMNMRTVVVAQTMSYFARPEKPTGVGTTARCRARYADGRFVPHLQLGAAVLRHGRLAQLQVDEDTRQA